MNLLDTLLGLLKGAGIAVIIPLIRAVDPAAGQLLQDASDAFAPNSKFTLDEAEKIALDAIAELKERLPKFNNAFDLLAKDITDDIPLIANKLIPDFEETYNAFKNAQ